jgi:hypothetical protein
METGQRRERGASGVGLLIFVIAIGLGVGGGFAFRRSQPAPLPPMALDNPATETIPSTEPPDSSRLELPTTIETSLAPETTQPPPETTQPPPPVTEPAAPPLEVTLETDGALVSPSGEERLVNLELGCDGYTQRSEPGSSRSCDEITVGDTPVVWLDAADTGQMELLVRQPDAEGELWQVALTGPADGGKAPVRADITGDGRGELLLSRRTAADELVIDVISVSESSAAVTLHLTLPRGRARYEGGRLSVWAAGTVDGKLALIDITPLGDGWQQKFVEYVDESAVGSSQL